MAWPKSVIGICPLLLITALLSPNAFAGLFDDDEARARIEELFARQEAFEDQQSRSLLQIANELEKVREDMSRLRGQFEKLQNQANVGDRRQQDYYVDLDNRLRKLEKTAVPGVSGPLAAGPEETELYEKALAQFKSGRFRSAASSFTRFMRKFPQSSLGPGAQLWTGYAWAAQNNCARAKQSYERLIKRWPQSPKAADAMLALSDCQGSKTSRLTLKALLEKYPQSNAATKAKQKLESG